MKKLWKSFKVLLFLLTFPIYAYSIELSEYGLNLNDFSELKEIRTLYISKQEGEDKFINPEEDFNNSNKIENYFINNNFLSNEKDTIYQFCCNSKGDFSKIFVGKINNASEKFQSLNSKDVLNLDNEIKVKNVLYFQNNKLIKSVFIKDDKYNLLQADPEKKTYTLYLNSPLKFKDTISSVGEVQWSDFSITDFDLEIEFTPVYKSIQNLTEGIFVFKAPQLDIFLVADDRSGKIIYTDENLKKIKYHGDFDSNADITNPSSYLNPTLLNFLPTNLKKILDKGRKLDSNYPLNYTLDEIMELTNNSEKLNIKTINFAKQKESELETIIQKKQAELKAEEDKANAEKLKAAQLEEQKAQEERQRILDQQAEEENQRMLAEYEAAEAEEKRQKYMQYGLIILLIGGLIAFIFFTNFLDNLQKFLKQIFSKFKKKKEKSYLPKDYGKKKGKQKKQLGIWWADWANSYEKPLSATLIVTISYIVGVIVVSKILQITELENDDTVFTILFLLFMVPVYYIFKLWAGIIHYHCPKCKRIHAGEIYSSAHIGSKQRARKYRVQDNRTLKYRDHRGISQKSNYTIERDETGVEQIDTYHNKAKCLLCNHKWEYNSSTSTRVA